MRRVTILGATGSVGQNTIDLIRRHKSLYEVVALTGGRNIVQLAKDAIELDAEFAVTAHDELLQDLRNALSGSGVKASAGSDALTEAAAHPAEWVMSAIVGVAGLAPGLVALEQGATLALANKETLVSAGPLVLETARKNDAQIIPVDSEHSAIFQALQGEDASSVSRVIITASGGAFRDWPTEKLASATPEQAALHPNWSMGQRITVDSASMFNKALEVIETREFFGFSPGQIEVVIHPESLVHALVGFCDGGLMAHVGPPDMRHAIGYALNWPKRLDLPVEPLDLTSIGSLNFSQPDLTRFPALRLAREVMAIRGLAGATFNAAKERALDHFIARRIGFCDMNVIVEKVLEQLSSKEGLIDTEITLDTVHEADHVARQHVDALVGKKNG